MVAVVVVVVVEMKRKWPCKNVALTRILYRYIIIALAFYVKPDDAGEVGKNFFSNFF